MKPGVREADLQAIENLGVQSDTTYTPTPAIIAKIAAGDLQAFKAELQTRNVTLLNLEGLCRSQTATFFSNLGQALQGCNVTTVDLTGNDIGKYAPAFAQNLQGTNINTLELELNSIGEHAPALALNLQGTNVTTLKLMANGIGEHAPALAQNLQGTKVMTLELESNSIGKHAPAFAQNLQCSNVTTLKLQWNGIGEYASDFVRNLQGTNVTMLDLTYNRINAAGAQAIARYITDADLLNVALDHDFPELSRALTLNQHKLLLTPYYAAALKLLPNSEKIKNTNLGIQKLNSEEGRLQYAGGILMHDSLPEVLLSHILGFLPLVKGHNGTNQTTRFIETAKRFHPHGLQIQDSQMQDSNDTENKKRPRFN